MDFVCKNLSDLDTYLDFFSSSSSSLFSENFNSVEYNEYFYLNIGGPKPWYNSIYIYKNRS